MINKVSNLFSIRTMAGVGIIGLGVGVLILTLFLLLSLGTVAAGSGVLFAIPDPLSTAAGIGAGTVTAFGGMASIPILTMLGFFLIFLGVGILGIDLRGPLMGAKSTTASTPIPGAGGD